MPPVSGDGLYYYSCFHGIWCIQSSLFFLSFFLQPTAGKSGSPRTYKDFYFLRFISSDVSNALWRLFSKGEWNGMKITRVYIASGVEQWVYSSQVGYSAVFWLVTGWWGSRSQRRWDLLGLITIGIWECLFSGIIGLSDDLPSVSGADSLSCCCLAPAAFLNFSIWW